MKRKAQHNITDLTNVILELIFLFVCSTFCAWSDLQKVCKLFQAKITSNKKLTRNIELTHCFVTNETNHNVQKCNYDVQKSYFYFEHCFEPSSILTMQSLPNLRHIILKKYSQVVIDFQLFTNCEELELNNCSITNQEWITISKMLSLKNFTLKNDCFCIKNLIHLNSIENLCFDNCSITNYSLRKVHFRRLRYLKLFYCDFIGLDFWLGFESAPALCTIDFTNGSFSEFAKTIDMNLKTIFPVLEVCKCVISTIKL